MIENLSLGKNENHCQNNNLLSKQSFSWLLLIWLRVFRHFKKKRKEKTTIKMTSFIVKATSFE